MLNSLDYKSKKSYIVSLAEVYKYLEKELAWESRTEGSYEEKEIIHAVFVDFVNTFFNKQTDYDILLDGLMNRLIEIGYMECNPKDLCDVLMSMLSDRLTESVSELTHIFHIEHFRFINKTDVLIELRH